MIIRIVNQTLMVSLTAAVINAAVTTSLYKHRPFTPTNITPFYTRFIYATLTSRVFRARTSSFLRSPLPIYGVEHPAWVR